MATKTTGTPALIQEAIERVERNQRWTADKSGIALTTFRRKMNGGVDFTTTELIRIAGALDTHPADLLPVEFHKMAVAA